VLKVSNSFILFLIKLNVNFLIILKSENCKQVKPITETFKFLNLEIPTGEFNQLTISDLVIKNFEEELINDRKCEMCNNKECFKRQRISSFPLVLVLVVKRFFYKCIKKSYLCIKKTTLIEPTHSINISNNSYSINSIINHVGINIKKGHYYTDKFLIDSRQWVRCNDNSIEKITEIEAFKSSHKNSYILFYTKD
jgi:uncharacterized UBP type Zn finger protein